MLARSQPCTSCETHLVDETGQETVVELSTAFLLGVGPILHDLPESFAVGLTVATVVDALLQLALTGLGARAVDLVTAPVA